MSKKLSLLAVIMLFCVNAYALTDAEENVIKNMLTELNKNINEIIQARDDVNALLRIHQDIASDTEENNILSQAKIRAKTAAQGIINLLSQ